ncbi:hypothetical protein KR032_004867, partial [Drosophila birchii]
MKFRLTKCCFLLPLGRGCLIISLILIFFELIAPPLSATGSLESSDFVLSWGYKMLNVIHTLGCLMLFASYFLRYSGFVLVFLGTLLFHSIVLPIFLLCDIYLWETDLIDTAIALVGEGKSYIYFSYIFYIF